MKESLDAWKNDTGLNYISRPGDFLEEAINFSNEDLANATPDELSEVLLCLSNYYLYLQNESGHIYARLSVMRSRLDQAIYEESWRNGTIYSLEERRAKVVSENEDLAATNEKLLAEKAKLDIIKPVLEGLKTKIDSIQRIMFNKSKQRD